MNSDPTRRRPPTWTIVLAFALIYISWGTTFLAIQKGVGVHESSLPPALFGGGRVCAAGLVLLIFLLVRGHKLAVSREDWGKIIISGMILFVFGNGLITFAERTLASGVAAVLVATTPLWIGLCEMFWPRGEKLNARGWLGLMVGLGGVLVLLLPRLHDPVSFFQDAGPLLVLGSAASWALGSVLMRHRRLTCPHLPAAALQMIVGGGCLALAGLLIGEKLPDRITGQAAGAFMYLLVVGSLVGFVAYNWLLGHVPAAKVGTYAYVNPVVAVFIGWLDGEELTSNLVGGIFVILVGVALVRGGEKSRQEQVVQETAKPVPGRAVCTSTSE